MDRRKNRQEKKTTWFADAWKLPPEERARVRSKTFPGIAKAMAEQWTKDKHKRNTPDGCNRARGKRKISNYNITFERGFVK